jgi:phosphate transport system permease protein
MALNISPQGSGVLTASLVLAIMIVPYAASLSAEFIKMVPNDLKEGAYSLGATRAEMVRKVVFQVAGSGIFSSYVLAIGRALGETMTVTMLIGNTNNIPESITSTGNSMASIIANQFGEADGLRLSSLIAIGLVLFLITAIINMIAIHLQAGIWLRYLAAVPCSFVSGLPQTECNRFTIHVVVHKSEKRVRNTMIHTVDKSQSF